MSKIVLNGYKWVYNLDSEEKAKIKDDLLVENPSYIQAKIHSGYNSIKIPKYLSYYEETRDYIKVPLGYKINASIDLVIDERVEVTVPYPRFYLTLRKSQEEAVKAYLDDPEKGIIAMPTGKGKSLVGIYLAYILRQKTLVIMHKDDLIKAWGDDIRLSFKGKIVPGLIKASSRRIGDQITLATVQTLNRLSEEEWEALKKEFGLVVVDEMHHAPAMSYEVISHFYSAYRLGLSATPERTDGLDEVLLFYFNDFAYVFEAEKREEDEDILSVEVIAKDTNVYYRPMVRQEKTNNGKYRWVIDEECGTKYIDEIPYNLRPKINYSNVDDLVVRDLSYQNMLMKDILEEYNQGHNILVFLSQKEHCRIYYDFITTHIPESEVVLYYGDSTEKTDVLLPKIESGKYRVTIATYKKATEGTNVKAWEVEFLVSSINNEIGTEQASGRIRRIKEGKMSPVRIYDYRHPKVYSFGSHGSTRDKRYKKLGFKVIKNRPIFSRGYKRSR